MPVKKLTQPVTRDLRETALQDGIKVDPNEAVFSGVKILGSISQNKRRYTMEAKQAALPMYEGIKVNLNHPSRASESRKFEDRFGKLVNVRMDGEDPVADLRYNPKHPLAETAKWWAENEPDCLGLSHNAVGQGHDENGVFVVEKIVAVRSVDLVADPATTKGLYEDTMPDTIPDMPADGAVAAEPEADFRDHLFNAFKAVQDSDPDMANKILAMLKLKDAPEEEDDEEDVGDAVADAILPDDKKKDEKKEEAKESVRLVAKYKSRDKLLAEAKLPGQLLTAVFLESLLAAKDEKAMKSLIEDRKQVGSIQRPRSSSPGSGHVSVNMDAKAFAQKLNS